MVLTVSVVHPPDDVADKDLQLAATAQHFKSVSLYRVMLAQEKIKIQHARYNFY